MFSNSELMKSDTTYRQFVHHGYRLPDVSDDDEDDSGDGYSIDLGSGVASDTGEALLESDIPPLEHGTVKEEEEDDEEYDEAKEAVKRNTRYDRMKPKLPDTLEEAKEILARCDTSVVAKHSPTSTKTGTHTNSLAY